MSEMRMRRTRARALAVSIVGLAMVGSAYADLLITPTPVAQTSFIPASTVGDVVFSVRNNTGSTVMITGLSSMFPATGDSNACPSLMSTPMTASLGSGQQQQFKIDTAGFPVGNYSCTYQVNSNPAMVPTPQVTVRFQVSSAPSTGNVQPTQMDFGTQGSMSFEQQTLYATNYGPPAMGMQLSITGDLTNSIVFGAPCDNQTSCFIGSAATNATGTVPIKCVPKASGTFNATVNVMGVGSAGSAAYGSTQVTCSSPSFGMLSITPQPIVIFGPQGVQSSPVTVTVNYSGSGGSAVLTGAMMMGDPSLGIVQCGGASCSNLSESFPAQLDVYCTPSMATTGSLFVTDNNGDMTSATVNCNTTGSGSGSGGMPFMTVSPMNLGFMPTAVNSSMNGSAQIANQGTAQLDNIQIAIGGINGSDFTVSPCEMGNPCMLAPGGATQDITFVFTPHGIGLRSATATVTANDPLNSPQTINLSGSGAGAVMTLLSPANSILDFGTIPRGQPVMMPITIGDSGDLPLNATITGVGAPYTADQGTIFVPGPGSNSFQITCQSATASANNDQTFTISSTEAYMGSPQTVTVHCAIANTQLNVNPNPIHLGEHRVGSPEATQDVTLMNPAGAAPATIQHVQLDTPKTGLSVSPPDTMTTLSAGGSASVTLHLSTAAEVDLGGENLNIAVDGEMLQIPVDGKVVTASSRIAPAALDLGTACVGTQVSGSVSLINTGTATLQMADAPTMDQNFTASFVMPSTYPSSLAPGATAVTTVSPAMSAMGLVTGTLEWKDDVPSDYHVPVTLEYVVSGTAISPAALDFGTIEVGTPGSSQQITIQNCEALPAQVKVRSLRATSGPIGAWTISPTIGNAQQLGSKGIEVVTAHFQPPGRGRYEAELQLDTPTGIKTIKLIGEGTGKDLDDTSVYACSCSGTGAGGGWPIALALVIVLRSGRRRRGSSSPR